MMVGELQSRSVQLNHITRKVPVRVKKRSMARRLRRFMDNGAVQMRTWYEATARQRVAAASVDGQICLLIDVPAILC